MTIAARPQPANPDISEDRIPVPAFMTIRDVADTCQLSDKAVRRAIADGELVAIKVRSRLRIERTAFDAWITSNRQAVTRHAALPRPSVRPSRQPRAGTFRKLISTDPTPVR